jgi:hypothetical protein
METQTYETSSTRFAIRPFRVDMPDKQTVAD